MVVAMVMDIDIVLDMDRWRGQQGRGLPCDIVVIVGIVPSTISQGGTPMFDT